MRNCTVERDSTKNRNQRVAVLLMKLQDTTLLSQKFTPPVSDNFIQIFNVSSKRWILVFQGKFGQINICNSLVTDGKYPKTLLKVYLASQILTALFFNCVFFQFSSKKILLIAEYLLLLMQLKFYMMKK